jgi:replicative DNA helicase
MPNVDDNKSVPLYPADAVTRRGTRPSEVNLENEGRLPPQAVDVEMAVLGSMLIEKDAVTKSVAIIDDSCFYKDAHREIFRAITALFERSEPVDLVTLTEELRRRGHLEDVGGAYYLTELTGKVTSAANVEYHAQIILEKSLMRQLIAAATQIAARGYSEMEDAFELLDRAETDIFRISDSRLKKTYIQLDTAVHDTMALLESIHGKHSGVTGVPSGFTQLDNLTGGFQNSDLIIIAGRPSMGKTSLALSCARNAAVDHNIPVGLFSLEMSATQLVLRLLCAEARVDAHAVRTGRLPENQWANLSTRAGRIAKAPIYIDDTAALSVLELRAKARRLKNEHNVGLVIVDYLQLMAGPKNAESREREISAISRSLKALAKELDIPVVALSQLSRKVEERGGDKRPILSDLRESGSIEQDADVVIFVHRAEVYRKELDENNLPTEGIADIIIGKQRNGPIDDLRLAFVKEYARFENLAPVIAPEEIPSSFETPPF